MKKGGVDMMERDGRTDCKYRGKKVAEIREEEIAEGEQIRDERGRGKKLMKRKQVWINTLMVK